VAISKYLAMIRVIRAVEESQPVIGIAKPLLAPPLVVVYGVASMDGVAHMMVITLRRAKQGAE